MIAAKRSLYKINAFSSKRDIRDDARLQMIQDFQTKAAERNVAFVVDALINGRLFPHVLENYALCELIESARGTLTDYDFEWWTQFHSVLAIKDHAFEQAKLLMAAHKGAVELDVDSFPVFTPEILEFLESESASGLFDIKPFLNMSWDNQAGHEGFLLFHRIVGASKIKRLVLNDKNYESVGDEYSALGLMARLGLLDDFLDRKTINLLIARAVICLLNEHPDPTVITDFVSEFESGRLLEVFAAEAKFGKKDYVTHAMTQLLPYLTTANTKP